MRVSACINFEIISTITKFRLVSKILNMYRTFYMFISVLHGLRSIPITNMSDSRKAVGKELIKMQLIGIQYTYTDMV
jgi:hypothetical protein